MQFLKILFWCLLAFLAAIFTVGNWTNVPIQLWGGLIADVNLPLLLLVTFLIGFVPMLGWHRWSAWRWRQRLATSERALGDLRAVPPPVSPIAQAPVAPTPIAQAPTVPPPPPFAPPHEPVTTA